MLSLSLASWKENLLNRKNLIQVAGGGARKFRNDISAIPVSSIAQQFYCEMMVEQDYIHGEVQTETKEQSYTIIFLL
jgi:hypothetical protein